MFLLFDMHTAYRNRIQHTGIFDHRLIWRFAACVF